MVSTMGHIVMIAEKPSVAIEYVKALALENARKSDGFIFGKSAWDNKDYVVTWTVGHLVTLSYPEKYDEKYKKWNLQDLPFLPEKYKYEIISAVSKQFKIVKNIYNDANTEGILLAGDSGQEGYYIQSLVISQAKFNPKAWIKVVWIDSQTTDEIRRGIKSARPATDPFFINLKNAGYMRAIEDYAMGINFSRALTCKYGKEFNNSINSEKWVTISVGRVMTCVLGMIVDRENAIKSFKPVDFWKIEALTTQDFIPGWKAVEGTKYYQNKDQVYQDYGFYSEPTADEFTKWLNDKDKGLTVESITKKEEQSQAPLLFSLADLQNECSKRYKISPDKTLEIAQKLYESKLTTYPRTDARVLTSAIAKEITKNLNGLLSGTYKTDIVQNILNNKWYEGIEKTKYVNDKKVTDHYAIIPTGQVDTSNLENIEKAVYELIVDRFLSIFYPAAIFLKGEIVFTHAYNEKFFLSGKSLIKKGYLEVTGEEKEDTPLPNLNEGDYVPCEFATKKATTKPPKRFTSGSMIIAMENAGNYIDEDKEDEAKIEELKEQLKGSGIGTSATRAEILKKLVKIGYISLTSKTQIYEPTDVGYKVYDIVKKTIPALLSPKMTASWQMGLSKIEHGEVTREEFTQKLNTFIKEKIAPLQK